MKPKMKKSESQMKLNTWKFYMRKLGLTGIRGWVLHHTDPMMKHTDPKRYREWRIEDVEPMTIQKHRSLHMRE